MTIEETKMRFTSLVLAGQRFNADIIPLGGGLPINVGGMDTIGAIGISGSPPLR